MHRKRLAGLEAWRDPNQGKLQGNSQPMLSRKRCRKCRRGAASLYVCFFVCRGADSSVHMELRRFHFHHSFHRSWCLVLSVFSFLQKEGTQMGKQCTWT